MRQRAILVILLTMFSVTAFAHRHGGDGYYGGGYGYYHQPNPWNSFFYGLGQNLGRPYYLPYPNYYYPPPPRPYPCHWVDVGGYYDAWGRYFPNMQCR